MLLRFVHFAVSSVLIFRAKVTHAVGPLEESDTKDDCIDPAATARSESSTETPPPLCSDSTETSSSSPLARARSLNAPPAFDTQNAEFEHASFWDDHGPLLHEAWSAFDEYMSNCVPLSTNDEFISPKMLEALSNAFENPSEETEFPMRLLWTDANSKDQQPLPRGVYSTQLLTPSGIFAIRELLDRATTSGIPTRRPNGMNRRGVIIDSDVYGAVSMKSLVKLVEGELIDRVVRPVGRMLFPSRVGCNDDVEYFAFTIRYDGGDDDAADSDVRGRVVSDAGGTGYAHDSEKLKHDFELKEHRDASIITLNINLNLPEEDYSGSQVYFRATELATIEGKDDLVPKVGEGTVSFTPGMAVIHLGAHRHGALPISSLARKKGSSGKRYNLVIWLFGNNGDVRIAPYGEEEQMSVVERWHGCNNTRGFSFD